MGERALTFALFVAAAAIAGIAFGLFRPARAVAAVAADCCTGVTAAYGLVFTDHCDGTVTVTVANPSTMVGHITINDEPAFQVAPNKAVTRKATPVGGILTLTVQFTGRPDTILHQWSPPGGCPQPQISPMPAEPSHKPAPAPARGARPSTSPATPAPAAAPAAAGILEEDGAAGVNTPSSGRATFWRERDSNSSGYPVAAALIVVSAVAIIFPYRRPNRSKT